MYSEENTETNKQKSQTFSSKHIVADSAVIYLLFVPLFLRLLDMYILELIGWISIYYFNYTILWFGVLEFKL